MLMKVELSHRMQQTSQGEGFADLSQRVQLITAAGGEVVMVDSTKMFLWMVENIYPSYQKRRCRP